jgi:hypothetical protein
VRRRQPSSAFVKPLDSSRIRGLLGSTLRLFFGLGVLFAYIFGAVLPYHLVPFASAPFAIVFLYGFWNVPETPLYLLKKKRFDVRRIEVSCDTFNNICITGS